MFLRLHPGDMGMLLLFVECLRYVSCCRDLVHGPPAGNPVAGAQES